jgi:GT2 family glycosyltransferase
VDEAPLDAVVIGRNEGARLVACLSSLAGRVRRVVYVDSGSTDGSPERAAALGAETIALDPARPFTAARARNAGFRRLMDRPDPPALVQFVDGDCTVDPGWLPAARAFLAARPDVALVCGRRRERHPEASLWNRLIDAEWDTPPGEARACGGDALVRAAALAAIGGFRDELIAGEEPEMCLRLRRAGHRIWRLDAEMTVHDAAMTRFAQWWRRSRRAGHAFAEGAALHGRGPERHWVAETRRALLWGAALPAAAVLGALADPRALLLLLAWPLQAIRLVPRAGWPRAAFLVIGKVAEAQGVLGFWLDRLRGRRRRLIEYK